MRAADLKIHFSHNKLGRQQAGVMDQRQHFLVEVELNLSIGDIDIKFAVDHVQQSLVID